VAARSRLWPFALAGLAYVGLRLAAYLPSSIGVWPDSGVYLHVSDEPLLSEGFLAGWRPWTVPLLYKAMPDSDTARAAGQLVVSISCWLALAAAVAWNVRRRGLRAVAFCLVLLFSLSVWITQWDRLILSESLALSLAAAVLAAWLALVRAPSPWTIAAVLGTTLLWAFVRDTIAYMALLAVPFVLVWVVLPGRRRGRVALAAGLVAIFAASLVAQSSSTAAPRRENPLLNVVLVRVLTDADKLRYFRDHGMPLPDPVLALAGSPHGSLELRPDQRLGRDRRVEEFLRWVRDEGRQTLASYLVRHPYRAVKPVVEDAELMLATEPTRVQREGQPLLADYRPRGADPLLPAPVSAAVYLPSVAAVLVWLAVVIAAAAWLARLGLARPIWLVPAVAVLLQIPHAVIAWHGDSNDLARHGLTAAVVTRLGLLVLSIFLIDTVLERRASALGRRAHQDVG
jgi:hypothetical protein